MRFLKDLQENEDCKILIDIGTCGLRTLHNAFKARFKNIGWKIGEFLKALFYLFHKQPGRREDYLENTIIKLFPLHFSGMRWIEDGDVAERERKLLYL